MPDFRDFENLADPDERSQRLRTAAHELIQQTGEAAGSRTQHYGADEG